MRKGALPQNPDAYKFELPADFRSPAGKKFEFDAKDPLLAQARTMAHAEGMSQDAFSKMLGLYAGSKLAEEGAKEAFRADALQKLGPTATARIDSVLRWFSGMDPTTNKQDAKVLAQTLDSAPIVEAYERLITRVTSQGSASFSQQHRVAPDANKIPGFEGMSFEQRRHAQEQIRSRQSA